MWIDITARLFLLLLVVVGGWFLTGMPGLEYLK